MTTDTHQTHRVRQVLMNELGLTRETVRAEMLAIVSDVVDKKVDDLVETGVIARMVNQSILKLAQNNQWDKDSFRTIVSAEAQTQMAEFIKNNIKIATV